MFHIIRNANLGYSRKLDAALPTARHLEYFERLAALNREFNVTMVGSDTQYSEQFSLDFDDLSVHRLELNVGGNKPDLVIFNHSLIGDCESDTRLVDQTVGTEQ